MNKRMMIFTICFVLALFGGTDAMGSEENVKVVGIKYIGADTLVESRNNSVYDIDMDPEEKLYIPDFRNDRVIVLNSDMEEIFSINGVPSPHGIAVDNKGYLYVATYRNGRVLKFNPQGQKVDGWGKELKLKAPVAVDTDGADNVVIADYGSGAVIKASEDGEYLMEFNANRIKETGEFLPHGVNADSGEYIYVADRGKAKSIHVFRPDGTHAGTWERLKADIDPLAVKSLAPNVFMVPDYTSGKIYLLDAQGKYITELGSLGDKPGQFLYVTNLASDGKGTIYVVEQDGNRVQMIDLSGIEDPRE